MGEFVQRLGEEEALLQIVVARRDLRNISNAAEAVIHFATLDEGLGVIQKHRRASASASASARPKKNTAKCAWRRWAGGYVKDLPAPVLVDRVASDPVQNEERLHRFWSQNVVTVRACAGGE